MVAPWCGVIKRDVLIKNSICFDTRLSCAEDAKFWGEVIDVEVNVRYITEVLYKYRLFRKSSAMSSMQLKHLRGRFEYFISMYQKSLNEGEKQVSSFYLNQAVGAAADIFRIKSRNERLEMREVISKYQETLKRASNSKYKVTTIVIKLLGDRLGCLCLRLCRRVYTYIRYEL